MKIDYLIIVTTDTPGDCSRADVISHHTNSTATGGLGLNRPRIDDLITKDGNLEGIIPEHQLSPIDLWGIAQGPKGLTSQAKYVALSGGLTKDSSKAWDTRTREQKAALKTYVKFMCLKNPGIRVLGLNQVPAFDQAESPCFNVPKWLKSIGIEDKNIF